VGEERRSELTNIDMLRNEKKKTNSALDKMNQEVTNNTDELEQ